MISFDHPFHHLAYKYIRVEVLHLFGFAKKITCGTFNRRLCVFFQQIGTLGGMLISKVSHHGACRGPLVACGAIITFEENHHLALVQA